MKKLFLILSDIILLYVALLLTLLVRYGAGFYEQLVDHHFTPFTIIFGVWLIIFYIAGLYDFRRLRNNLDFLKTLGLTLFVNALLSVLFFYLIPVFGITPKTNLFIFFLVFGLLETVWRRLFNRLTLSLQPAANVLLIGSNKTSEEISDVLAENPQLGYRIKLWLKEHRELAGVKEIGEWRDLIKKNEIGIIVIPRHFKKESDLAKIFYTLLTLGVEIRDLTSFYETVFRKVPLAEVSEEWFLDELVEKEKFYDDLKRGIEFIGALLLGIILLPLELLTALLVKISSAGPVMYSQTRIGENGKEFILYKFRTMHANAEKNGPQWAKAGDKRITGIGKILRYSHLDELPQLINILKGELSFTGPRPERPEFVELLRKKIPYYDTRHLVKPGVTGWAQIEYRYTSSVEDSAEKLKYDIYYIKNRSVFLDVAIILKTLKSFFINQ